MDDFVLLSRPHGPILEAAVEHFSKFWRFLSTFEFARPILGAATYHAAGSLPAAPDFSIYKKIPAEQQGKKPL
ncbi:hypothetical protein [Ligilactobacillus ruminis]|uniref:hypothetical protein n=1 Tax=Ligilactobacillus ruminis TaxID=1623 RepID=UPI00062CB26B|nr:hypothetical protein [Ligilactobacillus ruminis]